MVKLGYGKNIYGSLSVYLRGNVWLVCMLSGVANSEER